MCTVTFIPAPGGFFLTSNRDENKDRGQASLPRVYAGHGGGSGFIYPRDPDKGGSWIALDRKGHAAVLLNGAFTRHQRQTSYRRSRGLVFLDIIRTADPLTAFRQADLHGIEPFTLVLCSANTLLDCRWDGRRKHLLPLNPRRPYIWSSVTLYDAAAGGIREQWFREWLDMDPQPGQEAVVRFHQSAGSEDNRNGLVINREGRMLTVSVTSVAVSGSDARMTYRDLRTGQHTVTRFDGSGNRLAIRMAELRWTLKALRIRLTHWEYWPVHAVYGPLYLYWLWLSIRARSLFFFSAANPGIEYAGFTHERKYPIQKIIPQEFTPRTLFFPTGTPREAIHPVLRENGFDFPLIAKPDIGERGVQVKLLRSAAELDDYAARSRVDFLIQEYIGYENEVGIFYWRIPGEERGRISGIVGKEFLAVIGDGYTTVADLLKRSDRALLQLPALRAAYGNDLDAILPAGVRQTLVPYGNHCRGAKFIDLGERIDAQLESTIDRLCRQIPGFYFGRLDIRFRSWEDLRQGRHFSVIELNGAGSEPTHIYDPSHSLFFAWREIIRHWRVVFRISLINHRDRHVPLMSAAAGFNLVRQHARYLKMTQTL